jgi:hypothetical protein
VRAGRSARGRLADEREIWRVDRAENGNANDRAGIRGQRRRAVVIEDNEPTADLVAVEGVDVLKAFARGTEVVVHLREPSLQPHEQDQRHKDSHAEVAGATQTREEDEVRHSRSHQGAIIGRTLGVGKNSKGSERACADG